MENGSSGRLQYEPELSLHHVDAWLCCGLQSGGEPLLNLEGDAELLLGQFKVAPLCKGRSKALDCFG